VFLFWIGFYNLTKDPFEVFNIP